jgi:hypothetical protein
MTNYAQFIREVNITGCLLKQAVGHMNNVYEKVNAGDVIYIISNVLGKRVIIGELKVVKKFKSEKDDFIWEQFEEKLFKYRAYGIFTKYDLPIEVTESMATDTPQGRPLSDSIILRGGHTVPLLKETAEIISELAIKHRLDKLIEVEELN